MNIRDLEYFVALEEFRHFRRAAEACNVSQPTLSGQIRKLEEELGTMLLERTSRKVLFTHTGLLLVDQAKQILRDVKIFKDMAKRQSNEIIGPIHIGVIPTITPYLLPQVLPILQSNFPKLEVYLHEARTHQLLEQLEQGMIDCAILSTVKEITSFVSTPLFEENMYLAVPATHPWAGRSSVHLSELKGKQLLMLEDGHCLRDQALGYCFAAGIHEDKHFKATSLETLRSMIAMGSGMTLLPQIAVPAEKTVNGVSYIKCVEPVLTREITLIHRLGSPLRASYNQIAKKIKEHVPEILQAHA